MSMSLLDAEKAKYLPSASVIKDLTIVEDEAGESAVIDGVKYPVLTTVFTLRLIQPTTEDNDPKFHGHAGEFYIEELDEYSKERMLLPMGIIRYGQQFFGGPYKRNKENRPVCYSVDGLKPSPKISEPVCGLGGECAVVEEGRNGPYRKVICPKAVWENGEKPECNEYIVAAFLDITDPETPIPLRMTLKGTAISSLKNMNKTYERYKNVARLKRQNINDYAVKLTAEDNKNYFTPVFTPQYDEHKPSKFTPMRKHYYETVIMYDKSSAAQEDEESKPADLVGEVIDTSDAQAEGKANVDFEF